MSIGQLNADQVAQDIKYYLVWESDEIALTAKSIEMLQDAASSNEEILDYLTLQSTIVTETIDENYTGMYGYINGEYMDGSGWVPEDGYDPTSRPWYKGAIEGKGNVVYITPYLDSQTKTIMMSISMMLPDGKSVISLDISLDRIQKIIENVPFRGYSEIIVSDKNNIVVAAFDEAILGTDITDGALNAAYHHASDNGNVNAGFQYRSDDGMNYVVFSSGVGDQWNVFLIKKSSDLMRSLYYIYAILAAVSLAFIVFISVVFEYLNRRRITDENLNRQLESIADIYVSVYKLDIEHNLMEEVRSMPYFREQIRIAEQTAENVYAVLAQVMKALVQDKYWDDMKAFIDLQTLNIRMGPSNNITMEYLGVHGWAKARIIVLERKNDRISSILWLVEDIEEEKRKQNELRYLSETDLMTGIRNRGSGERMIRDALRDMKPGMFCLLDADHFKSINDKYGHGVGDEVIKAIANCMNETFRKSDIILRLGEMNLLRTPWGA